ncbi:MAG TPA: TerB family tellurite resistance protein, partial [Candidatus Acidoferrum sp.]|nr:TerB family tellurite resistance protein [Candidatus Acidoferrum sp.]
IGDNHPAAATASHDDGLPGADAAETAALRRIVDRLEAMPHDQARHLATYAYILARAAAADLDISDSETRVIERLLVDHGGVEEAQAVLVTEIAKSMARLVGGTEDYIVTREFREHSTPEERLDLLRACFLVGAADDSITAGESSALNEIANELGIGSGDVASLRTEFADKFSALQALRRAGG